MDTNLANIEFVNRAHELRLLCNPLAPRFVIIDAAAGYGKTYLLHRIEETYHREFSEWATGFVDLKKDPDFASDRFKLAGPAIAKTIAQQLSARPITITRKTQKNALEKSIAGSLVPSLANINKDVLLLFDGIEILSGETSEWLLHLVNDLYKGLRITQQDLRVIFAGRYVSDWGNSAPFKVDVLSLSPFELGVVRELLDQSNNTNDNGPDPDYLNDLSWWILRISGGHPKGICCIVKIVMQEGSIFPDLEFFFIEREFTLDDNSGTLFDLCVEPNIQEITETVEPAELLPILEALSPLRRFDNDLLRFFIDEGLIQTPENQTAWELVGSIVGMMDLENAADNLKSQAIWKLVRTLMKNHMISSPTQADPMYSDKIVRRMLAMRMILKDRDRFVQINQRASTLFNQWARGEIDSQQVRRVAIIESFFHTLQLEPKGKPESEIKAKLITMLREYLDTIPDVRLLLQLINALNEDDELIDLIEQRADPTALRALIKEIEIRL